MAVCTFFSWESFFAQVLIVPEKIFGKKILIVFALNIH